MKCPKILHWGPMITTTLIIAHTIGTEFVLYRTWRPIDNPYLHSILHGLITLMLCISYLFSMHLGPGDVSQGWEPKDKRGQLQFCHQCDSFKPPRAHHCRECGVCSLKMDHHCPWINGCVGWRNHKAFVLFLFYVILDGCHSLYIVGWRGYILYKYNLWVRRPSLLLDVISVGLLAFAVSLAVSILLYYQLKTVFRNKTDIEDWIVLKAKDRGLKDSSKFEYPYDVGYLANFVEVFGNSPTLWLWPTASHGDGIMWSVKEGCDQYTLTNEQLRQKKVKRKESSFVTVNKRFNKGWFGCCFGHQTWRTYPSMEDTRLSVYSGDIVMVTRDKKHWLYGEKIRSNGKDLTLAERAAEHGWIPRGCADEVSKKEHAKLAQKMQKDSEKKYS
eukprot:CFRG6062T1